MSLCTPLTNPAIERLSRALPRSSAGCEHVPARPGDYWVKLGLATVGEELDEVERAVFFSVINGDAFGEGRGIHRGLCVAPTQWSLKD